MSYSIKIGVIGLGLIGGSILKVLYSKGYELFAVSQSSETVLKAQNYSKIASLDINILKNCDLVFVCTPMNKTLQILDELETVLSPDAIVTDVCSLKRFLLCKNRPYKFIPSHPMAGTELSGFDNSFDTLFKGAKWVLTPLEENKENEIKILREIIEDMGASIIFSTPKEHDEAVALISHMPMLVSQAIFKTAQGNDLALEFASSGFKDMTRLALSNTEMANDMIKLNSDNIQDSVLKLYSSLGELLKEDYENQIEEIKAKRQRMF